MWRDENGSGRTLLKTLIINESVSSSLQLPIYYLQQRNVRNIEQFKLRKATIIVNVFLKRDRERERRKDMIHRFLVKSDLLEQSIWCGNWTDFMTTNDLAWPPIHHKTALYWFSFLIALKGKIQIKWIEMYYATEKLRLRRFFFVHTQHWFVILSLGRLELKSLHVLRVLNYLFLFAFICTNLRTQWSLDLWFLARNWCGVNVVTAEAFPEDASVAWLIVKIEKCVAWATFDYWSPDIVNDHTSVVSGGIKIRPQVSANE